MHDPHKRHPCKPWINPAVFPNSQRPLYRCEAEGGWRLEDFPERSCAVVAAMPPARSAIPVNGRKTGGLLREALTAAAAFFWLGLESGLGPRPRLQLRQTHQIRLRDSR